MPLEKGLTSDKATQAMECTLQVVRKFICFCWWIEIREALTMHQREEQSTLLQDSWLALYSVVRSCQRTCQCKLISASALEWELYYCWNIYKSYVSSIWRYGHGAHNRNQWHLTLPWSLSHLVIRFGYSDFISLRWSSSDVKTRNKSNRSLCSDVTIGLFIWQFAGVNISVLGIFCHISDS